MTSTYDIVVVGGGIAGASVAYHLARRGEETLLLDRGDEGDATSAGAGILSAPTSFPTGSDDWLEFTTTAVAYYPPLVERLKQEQDGPVSYDRTGILAVAVSESETDQYEALRANISNRRQRIEVPSPGRIDVVDELARERFPSLAPVHRAFHYTDAARIDGQVFTTALLAAGESHGLTVGKDDVSKLVFENGTMRGVHTATGDTVHAEHIVIAGGAWSGSFADQLNVRIPVEPHRGQIAHIVLPDAQTGNWPIVTDFHGHYLVPWEDGRIAVGATHEPDSGFDSRTTAAGVRNVLAEALRVAPGLSNAEVREINVGLRPATADGLPIIGAVPDMSSVYVATGFGPHGLQLGPFCGNVIADLITDEPIDTPIDQFSVGRFTEN